MKARGTMEVVHSAAVSAAQTASRVAAVLVCNRCLDSCHLPYSWARLTVPMASLQCSPS
jgi:hypothetical protein